jgi:isoleucyl-tRNA synthetase
VVAPQTVSGKLGAEITSRLWCASTDYSGDLAILNDKILARVVDAYRRIRNTLLFDGQRPASTRCGTLFHSTDAGNRALRPEPCVLRLQKITDILAHYGSIRFPQWSTGTIYCSEDLGSSTSTS